MSRSVKARKNQRRDEVIIFKMSDQPSQTGRSTEKKPKPASKGRHPLYLPYMYFLIILGLSAFVYASYRLSLASPGYQWMILAAAAGITGFYCVTIPSANSKISIGDSLVFTNLILFGVSAAVVTQAIDSLSASLRAKTRARRCEYILFNVAATSLAAHISGHVFYRVWDRGPLAKAPATSISELLFPLGVLAIVHYIANSGSVSLIVALEKRVNAFYVWKDSFLWTSVTYFLGATAAGLIAYNIRSIQPEIFIILVIVLLVVYFTYKTYLDKVAELQKLRLNLEAEVKQRTGQLEMATERAMLLADAAEAASRAKSDFLATMSHEIRTPLNAVIGYSEMLQEDAVESGYPQLVPDLQKIRSAGKQLLNIINDVLDFSKIEAGMLKLNLAKFSPYYVVDELIQLYSGPAREKGLGMTQEIDVLVPHQVIGDPDRLRQVLTNLIGNAIKFTEKGQVKVLVGIDNEEDPAYLRFEVKDTGVGVPLAAQKKIFQAFSQADGSTTRKYGGTGLGLAIVQRLVEMMNGEVGIQSEAGKGSNFWFTARFQMPEEEIRTPRMYVDAEFKDRY